MGWAMLAALMVLAAALLWWLRLPRLLWTSVGTALALGGAGYALQGHPGLAGASPKPAARQDAIGTAPEIIALRGAMWGKFTEEAAYEAAFDALLRAGAAGSAAKLAIGGVRRYPNSAELWTDLGSALVANDQSLSPPARFAFARAIALAPDHPAPRFFLGLALIESGRLPEARAAWAESLARVPSGARYRGEIADRLAALDQFIAAAQAAAAAAAPAPR